MMDLERALSIAVEDGPPSSRALVEADLEAYRFLASCE